MYGVFFFVVPQKHLLEGLFLIVGDLFYTRANLMIIKYVREDEIIEILKACHDEPWVVIL